MVGFQMNAWLPWRGALRKPLSLNQVECAVGPLCRGMNARNHGNHGNHGNYEALKDWNLAFGRGAAARSFSRVECI